jgi:hypothetical protein
MTETVDHVERGRVQALDFAKAQGLSPTDAEEFSFDYAAMIEDRLHELRYPDVPLPTPEEVWYS